MQFKAAIVIALSIVIVFALFAGCAQQGQTSAKDLKIGVVASMTGPASATGKDVWQSAVIATDEINSKGGVFVRELNAHINITPVLGDDESTREGGQKAVSKLINEDKVDVLVGGFSSAVTTAHQSIVAEAKVPYIITGASSPTITRRTDINTTYMFHHDPTTDDFGKQTVLFIDQSIHPAVNARFNFSQDRPLRLAVVYQDSPYGKGVLDAVANTIASEHLNVIMVDNETFKMGETDFRTVLTSVKAANPDAVYAAAFLNEQIPMVTQARRDVGLNTIFLAVECCDDPDYYKGLGNYGEFSILQSRFSPYTTPKGAIAPAVTDFRNKYEARWGGFPGMMGGATYEGVYITADSVTRAGTLNKTQVRDAIAKVDLPQMVMSMQTGRITFTNDFRESKFNLYMEQLLWDTTANALRPKIVWPANLQETSVELPDWYRPGNP